MKKKILKLVEKEGFILLLFLCVCAVAGGTIYLSTRNLNTAKKDLGDKDLVILGEQSLEENPDGQIYPSETVVDPSETQPEEIKDEVVPKEVKEEVKKEVKKVEEEEVVLASAEDSYVEEEEKLEFIEPEPEKEKVEPTKVIKESRKMILPIKGAIVTDYTKDSLVYSKTLDSWVGHKALDIGAKEGTNVVAALDGVVKEVYDDELWGIVIVIDHGDKLETRYSNLATKEMVKVGVNVKQGDHISKVGKTAKVEMLIEPHLHFEMINDGKIIDPRSITN